jgi:cytochrome o ubiquinol oxidase subunit 3
MDMSLSVHHEREHNPDISIPDPHQDVFSKTTLGFWIYLMTDCLIFMTLFATYAVLHSSTFDGPTSKTLFNLKDAFIETMILLLSSLTSGLAVLSALRDEKKNKAIIWLGLTFLLGAAFLTLELKEFHHFIEQGASWRESAFLSSFFTLVGTHGLHISVGLLWILVMIGQLVFKGLTVDTVRRLVLFSMFWHFLDLVWIFIFTFVYLMGVI